MERPQPLRPELASVCGWLAPKWPVRAVDRPQPSRGVLADLAATRGLQ